MAIVKFLFALSFLEPHRAYLVSSLTQVQLRILLVICEFGLAYLPKVRQALAVLYHALQQLFSCVP